MKISSKIYMLHPGSFLCSVGMFLYQFISTIAAAGVLASFSPVAHADDSIIVTNTFLGGISATFDHSSLFNGLTPDAANLLAAAEQYPEQSYLLVPFSTSLTVTFDRFWEAARTDTCAKVQASLEKTDALGTGTQAWDMTCRLATSSSTTYVDTTNLSTNTIPITLALGSGYTDRVFDPKTLRVAFLVPGNELAFRTTTDSILQQSDDPVFTLQFSLLVELKLSATSVANVWMGQSPLSVESLTAHVVSGTLSTESTLPGPSDVVGAVKSLLADDHAQDLADQKASIEAGLHEDFAPLAEQGFTFINAIGYHAGDIHLAFAGGASNVPTAGPGTIRGAFWWDLSKVEHRLANLFRPGQPNYVGACSGLSASANAQAGEGAWTNFPPTVSAGMFNWDAYTETNGYAICSYSIQNLPEHVNVRVAPSLEEGAFDGGASFRTVSLDFFQIPGKESLCRPTTARVPSLRLGGTPVAPSPLSPQASTLRLLQSPRTGCADSESNVNFEVVPPPPGPN